MKKGFLWILIVVLFLTVAQPVVTQAEYSASQTVKPVPVLFVHGYDDNGSSWERSEFYKYILAKGVNVYSVDYGKYSVNDITSDEIQRIFRDAINKLPKDSKFDIVGHSMGGLLTRYFLSLDENEAVRKRVRRVIMIGTPNHGSPAAFSLRIQDMLDDPDDYWKGGTKDKDIQTYQKYYEEYVKDMIDSYNGGQIQPYEIWLSKKHPEVIKKIKNRQFEGAGTDPDLKKVGTPVLDGGLEYRYSGAFEEYAKLMIGRALVRHSRSSTSRLIPGSEDMVQNDSISEKQKLVEPSTMDEFGHIKALRSMRIGEAKNIVQDRLMSERFDLITGVGEDGKEKKEEIISNLFLYELGKKESTYRYQAHQDSEYYPQYITVATVDSPKNLLGRGGVEWFIGDSNIWNYEGNDSVVPLSSVKLQNRIDPSLDRNVQILPDLKTRDMDIQKKEGSYISHSDQMKQTDVLTEEYENPFTGEDDKKLLFKLDPIKKQDKSGDMFIIRTDPKYIGQQLRLTIQAQSRPNIKVMKRDVDQTWDQMETVPMVVNNTKGWEGRLEIQPSRKVSDMLVIADREITLSYDPEQNKKALDLTPYFIETLGTKSIGNTVQQQFRVVDRHTGKSDGTFGQNDFWLKLNNGMMNNFRITRTEQTAKHSSSMVFALDYSNSMDKNFLKGASPKAIAKFNTERFLVELDGKTNAKVGLIGFTEKVKSISNFSNQLRDISKLVYIDLTGGTALYDAIVSGSHMLEGEKGKKSLIILTDGEDTDSSSSLEESINTAKRNNVTLYIVALGNEINMTILNKLAHETGGRVMHTLEASELGDIYNTITEEEDYIYTLEYTLPDQTRDNKIQLGMTQDRSKAIKFVHMSTPIKSWVQQLSQMFNDVREK